MTTINSPTSTEEPWMAKVGINPPKEEAVIVKKGGEVWFHFPEDIKEYDDFHFEVDGNSWNISPSCSDEVKKRKCDTVFINTRKYRIPAKYAYSTELLEQKNTAEINAAVAEFNKRLQTQRDSEPKPPAMIIPK